MGENGAKSYMKGDYEHFHALGRRKNKANFIVQRSECCGLRVDSRLRGNDK